MPALSPNNKWAPAAQLYYTLDAVKFREAWSLPSVQGRLRQARKLGPAAGLTGVPAVMVHGRHLALTRGNYEDLLAAINQLVARVRTETGMR